MTKTGKVAVTVMCCFATVLVTLVVLLFEGYFDTGLFEIKSAEWSTTKQVAIVARRSDNHPLDGDTYFVLIGDHLFSPKELRRLDHSDERVFSAGSDCLTVHWESSSKLIVTCGDSSIVPAAIGAQKYRSGDIDISYVNIPQKGTD